MISTVLVFSINRQLLHNNTVSGHVLMQVRGARDEAAWRRSLDALTAASESGDGNLLALSVDAARCRATVGEITDAMEQVCAAHISTVSHNLTWHLFCVHMSKPLHLLSHELAAGIWTSRG